MLLGLVSKCVRSASFVSALAFVTCLTAGSARAQSADGKAAIAGVVQDPDTKAVVDKASLEGLAQGEFVGEGFYEGWAKEIGNEEAAKLFRLNGKEEARHGERVSQAAKLLAGS